MARPAVDNGVIASLGKQLSNKVQSGDLTKGKATKVASQRKLLQNAFGDNWRVKVYGKGGAKGIGGPFAQGQVAADRSKAITQAKNKLNVGGQPVTLKGSPVSGGTPWKGKQLS